MTKTEKYTFPSSPWSVQGRRIESAIRKALYEFGLIDGVERVGVALSGGKDSVTLLLMLHAISGHGFPPFRLTAFHVAGEFSCGASVSTKLIEDLCAQLNIPLRVHVEEREVFSECYSCSRERRKALFRMAKEEGCTTLAFGHHQDDHVQTLVMNLFHKGEFAGLLPKVPMITYGVTIIRPLFFVREKEIASFAKSSGFQRLTCNCPFGQNSMRKQTETLLKTIEELYPHARSNIVQAVAESGSTKALLINKMGHEEIDV